MKKLFLLSAIAVSGVIYNSADAQIRVGLGIGFAPQRAIYATYQAPVYAGNGDVYYYLPDLGVYYNVTDQCYVYFDGSEWIPAANLPGQYSNYDWTTARRFEIDAFRPYLHDDVYCSRYNGHRFEGWARPNNYNRDAYANQGYRNADRSFDRNRSAFNQPAQARRDNNQGFDKKGSDNNSQQKDQNRGQDNKGGNDHFAKNTAHEASADRRLAKF